jgi:hypothetical protein
MTSAIKNPADKIRRIFCLDEHPWLFQKVKIRECIYYSCACKLEN